MEAKKSVLLDAEKAELIRARMRAELKQRFGGALPKKVEDMFENTLRLFPDFAVPDNLAGAIIPFESISSENAETNRICFYNPKELIESYFTDSRSGALDTRATPLEAKIWGLNEKQIEKLVADTDLPIEQRLEINEAWKNRPNPEKELAETLINDEIPISERLEAVYKFRKMENPETTAKAEAERVERTNDKNISVLDKIDDLLAK